MGGAARPRVLVVAVVWLLQLDGIVVFDLVRVTRFPKTFNNLWIHSGCATAGRGEPDWPTAPVRTIDARGMPAGAPSCFWASLSSALARKTSQSLVSGYKTSTEMREVGQSC